MSMTAMKRDPRTLEKAPEDESWLRGAALVDGAFAAADALAAEIAARTTTPGADDAGLFSRTAASDRIAPTGERATYPVAAPGRGIRRST